MARAGLLDVPGGERRHDCARREERVDLQPQLRWPPGTGRAHPSRQPRHGRGRCHRRPHRRRAVDLRTEKTMEAFTVLDAKAAPLMRQNVNTDIIIPIHRLRDVAQADLGPYAFEPWRYLADGSENPDFFLHQPAYRGAEIVVADNNFACGSSREGAVWAMMGMGVRCVIAPTFGPIFFNNCCQDGVLPIQLPRAEVLAIAAELEAATRPGSNSEPRLSVDLHNRTVTTPSGRKIEFQVDGIRRDALLKGLNEVALTLTREDEIAAHQAKARAKTPWLYPSPTN